MLCARLAGAGVFASHALLNDRAQGVVAAMLISPAAEPALRGAAALLRGDAAAALTGAGLAAASFAALVAVGYHAGERQPPPSALLRRASAAAPVGETLLFSMLVGALVRVNEEAGGPRAPVVAVGLSLAGSVTAPLVACGLQLRRGDRAAADAALRTAALNVGGAVAGYLALRLAEAALGGGAR